MENQTKNKSTLLAFRCTESELEMYKNVAALKCDGNVSKLIREALVQYLTKTLNKMGKPKRSKK